MTADNYQICFQPTDALHEILNDKDIAMPGPTDPMPYEPRVGDIVIIKTITAKIIERYWGLSSRTLTLLLDVNR